MAGGMKTKFLDFVRANPVQVYLGLGVTLMGVRELQTRMMFNYWFGKFEYQRRLERNKI